MRPFLPTFLLTVLGALPAAAQPGLLQDLDDTVTDIFGEAAFVAGAGVGITTLPYRDIEDGTEIFPIPLISYQSERFEFVGKTLEAELYETSGLAFSAVADWRFQGYKAKNSPYLTGMDDRKGTLEVGGRIKTDALGAQFSLTGLVDALSRHGGYELSAQASYELSSWRPLSLRPVGGVRYQSSNLSDYYFGVDPEEALIANCVQEPCPFRPAYETGDAFVPFAGVVARQALSYKIALFAQADYSFLPDSQTNSPIVEDDGRFSLFVGAVYIFGDAAKRIMDE
ncbi:MipA/OmpV family protein [Parvularcula dongshanensis]|uniref:Outer membrane protein n=1 Tax=Parvularcula dongshanensis TaxID=1173995 RepID=A0A840I309_9PROT|nr:MipA/OmpV family protein [Parvularcula dongshanensis]MBB4659147.1 outer membrane protein [Parvularcula dongshanensis]